MFSELSRFMSMFKEVLIKSFGSDMKFSVIRSNKLLIEHFGKMDNEDESCFQNIVSSEPSSPESMGSDDDYDECETILKTRKYRGKGIL